MPPINTQKTGLREEIEREFGWLLNSQRCNNIGEDRFLTVDGEPLFNDIKDFITTLQKEMIESCLPEEKDGDREWNERQKVYDYSEGFNEAVSQIRQNLKEKYNIEIK